MPHKMYRLDNRWPAGRPNNIMPPSTIVSGGIKSFILVAELGHFWMTGHQRVAMAAVAGYNLSYKMSLA